MKPTEDFVDLGYVRVAAVSPELTLADPRRNGEILADHLRALRDEAVSLVLFPELSLTGYSCEDLFFSRELHRSTREALIALAAESRGLVAVVGLPWQLPDGRLLDCAAVLAEGRVRGMVPKSALPNYGEFYERRWFASGEGVDEVVDEPGLGAFRICREQLFELGSMRFAIEVCEDLWSPRPPGIAHCLAGAELILNPSASNELVAKSEYRRDLARMASAQGICAYLYASSGPLESTKDVVFGGHLLAYEDGQPLAESERFRLEPQTLVVDVDVERLRHDRMQNTTFATAARPAAYPRVATLERPAPIPTLRRTVSRHPFVPGDEAQLDARAREILDIQATGLARRLRAARSRTLVIGLSGGLDSTLAFLVCLDALAKLDRPATDLHALTLPGPGTSPHTLESARSLCTAAKVPLREIPIGEAVALHLTDLGHESETDVVFENAQARERTQILFDVANQVGGLVVGTGDLSELALGWCTYNADHMASYNVNASVPKTMMAYLVRWYARHRAGEALASVLERVLATPISPELLAPGPEGITQETEAIIGPYELHDFFLWHFVRHGASPTRIHRLAREAFAGDYPPETLLRWMGVFFQRFFSQQFKRTTLPPGPKVGSISLSPRGDWRMPDEASVARILAEIDALAADLDATPAARRE